MIKTSIQYGDETPIAAFSTTPGNSALTLIRCSGKGSIDLAASILSSDKIKDTPGNTVIHCWVINKELEPQVRRIDEVLVSVFRGPKSYTGEDSIDICCHGGVVTGKAVMAALKKAGFRDALPGEFTFRAFMNGKLDLTQSESVMEIVSAKTEAGRRHSVTRLSGSLQKEIHDLKQLLVQVLASAEIFLDYSEDEISPAMDNADEAAEKLPNKDIALSVLSRLQKLSASWQIERIYQEGITVVIAGKPNAGKSSLFNAILKEDRSIVTEIPGTTRDWIEAWVSIDGIPIRLIDTAGLRESSDSIEKIGVERSYTLIREADIILYLIDGEQGLTGEDNDYIEKNCSHNVNGAIEPRTCEPKARSSQVLNSLVRHLFIWNKCDIAPLPRQFLASSLSPICVSAKTGEGLTELYASISEAIRKQVKADSFDSSEAALGTERQKKLVDSACAALEEALALTERDEPLDLIAPMIREAVNFLGEITGEVSTADILEEMFGRFCVGK